jgi:hypothetical protein
MIAERIGCRTTSRARSDFHSEQRFYQPQN